MLNCDAMTHVTGVVQGEGHRRSCRRAAKLARRRLAHLNADSTMYESSSHARPLAARPHSAYAWLQVRSALAVNFRDWNDWA